MTNKGPKNAIANFIPRLLTKGLSPRLRQRLNKNVILLLGLISVFLLSSCLAPNPDMSKLLVEESVKMAVEFPPDERTNQEAVFDQKAQLFLPDESWTGPTLIWALPVFSTPDIDRINDYLEASKASYRVGIARFFTESTSTTIGDNFYYQLQDYLEKSQIDLICVGTSRPARDHFVHELLLENQQVLAVELPEPFQQVYLQYQGNYYGFGNIMSEPCFGLFVQQDFAREMELNADAPLSWSWFSQQKDALNRWSDQQDRPVLYHALNPVWISDGPVLPESANGFLTLNEDGKTNLIWDTSVFQAYTEAMTALKPSALIYGSNLENSENQNEHPSCPLILCEEIDLQKKSDGSYCHLDSGEVGYFYPLGHEKRLSNWANSIENLIPLSSKHKPEAMDFARRLYQDPDLALIISADQDAASLTVKEWRDLQRTQGRLFNQYLLPAGQEFLASYDVEKNELKRNEDLWLGFYSPDFFHAPETDAIRDFFRSEEGNTLYWQILYPQAGSKEARDKMEDKLKELGLEKIILVLERDAQEFLEQN